MASTSSYDEQMKKYQEYVGGQQSYADALERAYQQKMNENKDLIAQQNQLQSNLYSLPTTLRSEYMGGPVRNPLEQEALIGQRTGNAQQALQNVADLLTNRKTRYEDILNKSMGQWGSETEAQRLSAEAAWQKYQSELAQEEAARQEAQRAFERDMAQKQYELSKYSTYNRGGGGGGGGGINYAWPEVAKPQYTQEQRDAAYAQYVKDTYGGTIGKNVSYLGSAPKPASSSVSYLSQAPTKKRATYAPWDMYKLYPTYK